MDSDSLPVDPEEPLALAEPPADTDDDALHDLVKTLESAVKGDIKWGVQTYQFVLHIVYLAATSETEYTVADLTAILEDDDRYYQFCAEEGGDQFPTTIGSPPSVKYDRVREFVVEQFATICESE